jgi:hypothetical protein
VLSLPAAVPDLGVPALVCDCSSCCGHPVACTPACAPASRWWFDADYLLWWVKSGPVPPLAVTGSLADPFPGALDQPGTRVLFGGSGLDYGTASGLRLETGLWLDPERRFALEAGGFLLESRSVLFSAASNAGGNPVLGLSFVNALTGNENVYLSSFPQAPVLAGSVSAQSRTRLAGWDVNAGLNVVRDGGLEVTLLGGFRSLILNEDLQIEGTFSTPGLPAAASFGGATLDRFHTNNQFYGPQVGGQLNWLGDTWSVGVVGKVALGTMQQLATVSGSSVVNNGGAITPAVGGVYALPSNIGRHFRDDFTVIPEIGINLRVRLSDHLQARVGYTFLYASSVARPGNQIDRVINPNQVPTDPASFGTPGGPARPAFSFRDSDFWAQGVSFGLELRY